MPLDIPLFVLTGGPGAGKTTAKAHVIRRLQDIGFTPLCIPETATLLLEGGVAPGRRLMNSRTFQECVFSITLATESAFMAAAREMKKRGKKPVVICDRGLMDNLAYIGEETFEKIALAQGFPSLFALRERYSGVFHLVTAADGAKEHYGSGTNRHRRETLRQARTLDRKVLAAWTGHSHIFIIDNKKAGGLEGKMQRLLAAICHRLGVPAPLEIERKYLVRPMVPSRIPVPYQVIDIEQGYVVGERGEEARVRKRGQDGHFVFIRTHKTPAHTKRNKGKGRRGARIKEEREKMISEREYYESLKRLRKKTAILRKKRVCFAWKDQYFELDIYPKPLAPLQVLEAELTDAKKVPAIPPFIRVVREVTNEKAFTNRRLAKKIWKKTR